jgi:hypothetical protein
LRGDAGVARHALVTALLPAIALNLVLALPVHALVRGLVGERGGFVSSGEVELVA